MLWYICDKYPKAQLLESLGLHMVDVYLLIFYFVLFYLLIFKTLQTKFQDGHPILQPLSIV